MPTANEVLRDRAIAHQVGLHRLSNREVRKILALLRPVLADANRELRRRLYTSGLAGGLDPGPHTTRALERVLRGVREVLAEGYAAIGDKLQADLLELAEWEMGYQAKGLRLAVPSVIALDPALVSLDLLRQLVLEKPMQGGLVGEWFRKTGKKSLVRSILRKYKKTLNQKIASGVITGQPIDKTVRQVALEVNGVARRHLRAVVDTSTKHATSAARDAFYDANAGADGVVKGVMQISTLDLRTTKKICVPRDHKRWQLPGYKPVGHSIPRGAGAGRLHWGCRSIETAWLKSWKELGIDADELGGSVRASMDGAVPDRVKWTEWAKGRKWESGELRDMFGKRRAAKILDGDMTITGALRQVGIKV